MTRQDAARSRRCDRGGAIVLDPALVGAALLGVVAAALVAVPGERAHPPETPGVDREWIASTFP